MKGVSKRMIAFKENKMAGNPLSLFTRHPASVEETYGEHLVFAASRGLKMLGAGSAAIVHAFLPFLFETTASRMMMELAGELTQRREEAEQNAANSVLTANR
jgi:hypothetical protein